MGWHRDGQNKPLDASETPSLSTSAPIERCDGTPAPDARTEEVGGPLAGRTVAFRNEKAFHSLDISFLSKKWKAVQGR